MTLADLIDTTLEEVGYQPSTASPEVRLRVRRRLNEWHRRLLAQPGLSRFLRETFSVTFASVASTAVYGLPSSVGRINSLYETTNDVKLEHRSVSWLRTEDPGLSASGTPSVYIPRGISAVRRQPSDASTCYVKSASASDTTQKATLVYLTAAGAEATATATLTGTTGVALGTGVVEIIAFHVTPSRAGVVTLHEDSDSGTELATTPIGQSAMKYLVVQLWPTPTDAITYAVDATRDSVDMAGEADEPLLPRDFHYLLHLGATADELRMRDDARYETVRADMGRGIQDLKSWIWNSADYLPASQGGGTSRLGGWFPAGS